MLQKAFGDLTMSQKNVYKWYKDFKEGRERIDDLERPGRPSTSTDEQHVNQIKELVHKNRQLTVIYLTDIVGISEGSVKTILKDHLGLKTLCFCTTIMRRLTLHSFFVTILPKTQRMSFHNHYIRLIWLL